MDLKTVAKDLSKQTDYRLEQRFSQMMYRNPNYRNLDAKNRATIMGLLKKYKEKKRRGLHISGLTVRQDMYSLYHNRIKLGLTRNDLDQIRDLLSGINK